MTGEPEALAVRVLRLNRCALDVAPALVGAILRVGDVGVRLTEVEAYEGETDPASHAFRGRTARNRAMFEAGGVLYVYRIHGHHCANVVCGNAGVASAVLLRAGEVVEGLAAARLRRPGVRDAWLARGPGNLCRALGITRDDDGASLDGPRVCLLPGQGADAVASGPRVNVRLAADRQWRFWDAASPSVSAYKVHARAGE